VFNRIAKFLPQASKSAPRPQITPINPTTKHDPCQSLPIVYHTCGGRCFWSTNPKTCIATPVCPKCERYGIAG
jgi:hypothetical protein